MDSESVIHQGCASSSNCGGSGFSKSARSPSTRHRMLRALTCFSSVVLELHRYPLEAHTGRERRTMIFSCAALHCPKNTTRVVIERIEAAETKPAFNQTHRDRTAGCLANATGSRGGTNLAGRRPSAGGESAPSQSVWVRHLRDKRQRTRG